MNNCDVQVGPVSFHGVRDGDPHPQECGGGHGQKRPGNGHQALIGGPGF